MTYSVYANKTRHDQTRLSRSPIVLLERAWRNVARAVTEFLFFAGAVTVWESLVQQLVGDVCVQAVWHPQKVMTVIIRVAITTLRCAVTSNVVCPPPTHTHTVAHTHLIWEQEAALWQCSWSWLTSVCAPGASAPAASPQSSWTFWSCLRKRGRMGRIYSAVKS